VDQTAQPETRSRLNPEASAWLILLVSFSMFCALVIMAALLGWRYYTSATIPVGGAMLRSHVETGVFMQARGQLAPSGLQRLPADRDPCPQSSDICVPLSEGVSIKTRREAGYGPVASLILPDESHIQLWASPTGADLSVERFQVSQWNRTRQEAVLNQRIGYARYDLASGQPYERVDFLVEVGGSTQIDLTPGGSYSIYVPGSDLRRPSAQTADGRTLLVEVAVRKGGAAIIRDGVRSAIAPGEKIQVAVGGLVGKPLAATWELIADGGFSQYHQQAEYATSSRTWVQYWDETAPGLSAEEKNFRFTVVRACRPESPDLCSPEEQVSIGQMRRDGGQTKSFTIGIEQMLDVDVSEYTSLRLRGWVRVLEQSIPGAGAQGSECPIMVQIVYKPTSPTDQEQPRYICVYSTGDGRTEIPDLQVIRYRPVPAYTWYQIDIELRDDTLIRQARYIQMIRIGARGHDYLSEVAGFSLVGEQ
jgi:hypothetical protein